MNIYPPKASTAEIQKDAPFKGITVSIKNDLDVPIDIFDVFDPSTNDVKQPYTYKSLGTIQAHTTGSVTTIREVSLLEAMYTGEIDELQKLYYYQFPIKLMSVVHFSTDTEDPKPITYEVTDDDRTAMIQSVQFHRFVMANPNSDLTTKLYAALKDKKPLDAVNTFFQGTANFKKCTLSSWNGVMAWLTMFTSGWQGGYYLYETPPNPMPDSYVLKLIGTVNIVSTAAANKAQFSVGSVDENGNLQRPDPPQVCDVTMAGDGTMSSQSGALPLKLTPVWMSVAQTSKTNDAPVTTYAVGPALSGTATNQPVVSTQRLMVQPGTKKNPLPASVTSSHTFNTICEVVGLLVGLGMGFELLERRFTKKQLNDNDTTANEDISDMFNESAASTDQKIEGITDGYARVVTGQQGDACAQNIADQSSNLDDQMNTVLEEVTPSQAFENAFTDTQNKLQQAQDKVSESRLAESSVDAKSAIQAANDTVSEASTSMTNTIKQQADNLQGSEADVMQQAADDLENASKGFNEVRDAMDTAQDTHDQDLKNADNDSGAGDEPMEESEPIPEGEI